MSIASLESQIARLKSPQVSAEVLLRALALRHTEDVFVAECKNGPTHAVSHHRKLDAWVLVKTWSPITCIGYEIKVSRGDWLRDNKIGEYMGLAHLFYLVTPKGLIRIEELPQGVGLLEMVGTNNRLVTRLRAWRREIQMPTDLLVYVLMCRAQITGERSFDSATYRKHQQTTALREWVAGKRDRQTLAYEVGRRIREAFAIQAEAQAKLAQRIRNLEHIEQRIRELGFDPTLPRGSWPVEAHLRQLSGLASQTLVHELESTEHRLRGIREQLQALRDTTQREVTRGVGGTSRDQQGQSEVECVDGDAGETYVENRDVP